MIVNVDTEKVEIELDSLPFLSGEYKVHECNFTFSQEYDGLIKMCVFTKFGLTYQKEIINDKCEIPYEVLSLDGKIILGVYAYTIEDDEVQLRYSPRPSSFEVEEGSYREHTLESGGLSPSEYDQLLIIIKKSIEEIQNNYQKKLIAGSGINISDTIISINPGRNMYVDQTAINTTADPNVIETIYLNTEKQTIEDKNVNIVIDSISVEDINELFR